MVNKILLALLFSMATLFAQEENYFTLPYQYHQALGLQSQSQNLGAKTLYLQKLNFQNQSLWGKTGAAAWKQEDRYGLSLAMGQKYWLSQADYSSATGASFLLQGLEYGKTWSSWQSLSLHSPSTLNMQHWLDKSHYSQILLALQKQLHPQLAWEIQFSASDYEKELSERQHLLFQAQSQLSWAIFGNHIGTLSTLSPRWMDETWQRQGCFLSTGLQHLHGGPWNQWILPMGLEMSQVSEHFSWNAKSQYLWGIRQFSPSWNHDFSVRQNWNQWAIETQIQHLKPLEGSAQWTYALNFKRILFAP